MREYKRGVKVIDGKVDQALRKFKKKITESGLLDELRARETYETLARPTTSKKTLLVCL